MTRLDSTDDSLSGQALPPMGWNSWNSGVVPSQEVVEQVIDAMIATGMRDAGYRYVNLDAGWAARERLASGELQAHPDRFPNGIAAVARYAHDRGMLLGIYASPYNQICGQAIATASAGHERTDADTFARWGVDFLKYDWCRTDADHQEQIDVFTAMRDALRDSGRRIVYSINHNSSDAPRAGIDHDWSDIADMVRVTGDLVPVWEPCASDTARFDFFANGVFVGVAKQFAAATDSTMSSRPGFWPDPDMLVVGSTWSDFLTGMQSAAQEMLADKPIPPEMGIDVDAFDGDLAAIGGAQADLTEVEERAHFSLWAMLAAPLLTGVDVRTMTDRTRQTLINAEVVAIDQDPLVRQATPLPDDPRVLVKPLADEAVAVAFLNPADHPIEIDVPAEKLGLPTSASYRVRDLWAHTDATVAGHIDSGVVPPHGVALLRVTASQSGHSASRP